jgi:hypothetical protein
MQLASLSTKYLMLPDRRKQTCVLLIKGNKRSNLFHQDFTDSIGCLNKNDIEQLSKKKKQ